MKKYTPGTIVLVVILAFRLVMQLVAPVLQGRIELGLTLISLTLAGLYLAALIGISRRRTWGALVAIVIGGIDILTALAVGGPTAIGAGIIDVVILFLAYREYRTRSLRSILQQ